LIFLNIRLAHKQHRSMNETDCSWLMNANDELYWRKGEACPCPCLCSSLVSLSFLIWWPPALVGEYLSFEITEQTPRTTRDTHFLCAHSASAPNGMEEAARGKVNHPKCPMCLSHARRYPAMGLHARFRLRASSSNRSPASYSARESVR